MAIQRVLANMTVTDLDTAVPWYTKLFGRAPDANPMDGLVEWHLDEKFGVQVWAEAERAGRSSMVLDDTDLDGRLASVTEAGLATTVSGTRRRPDPDARRSGREPDRLHRLLVAPSTLLRACSRRCYNAKQLSEICRCASASWMPL